MDLPVVLLVLTLLIAFVAAVGAWRKTTGSRLWRDDLASAERRLLDGVQRLRDSLDGAMRDAALEGNKAQLELATRLTATVERIGADIQKATIDRFLAVESRLAADIGEARRTQDERLDKIDASLRESNTAFLRTADDLRTSFVVAAKDQVESHSKATTELRETVSRALGDFAREVKESLAEARSSQDERLYNVEGALQALPGKRLYVRPKRIMERAAVCEKSYGARRTLAASEK